MIPPPIPANEEQRLAALASYEILDTPAEAAFDALTRAAAALCDTPIAMVSLIDRDRQWCKSKVGIERGEIPRQISVCAHALNSEGLFEIEDGLLDARFHDNPIVAGGPQFRFYAGVPLKISDNLCIGTLCVIDRKPRSLTQRQRTVLQDLSAAVIHVLDQQKAHRVTAARLEETNRLLLTAEQLGQFGYVYVEGDAREGMTSEGLLRILGISEHEHRAPFAEAMALYHPEDREAIVEQGKVLRRTGKPFTGEYRIVRPDGAQRDVQVWAELRRSADGAPGTFTVVQDITERKAAGREAARLRERFDALYNLVGDGILISDPATGHFVEANEAACRMLGYEKSELMALGIADVSSGIPPHTVEAALAQQGRRRIGDSQRFEWQCKTKDGALFWTEISSSTALFGGKPAVVSLLRDITERKSAQCALVQARRSAERAVVELRESNRLREAGERIAGFGVYYVKDGADQGRWSDQFFKIVGLNKSDGPGSFSAVLPLVHPEDRQRIVEQREFRWKAGVGGSEEYRIIRPDGTPRDLQLWIEPERGDDGRVSWYGVIQDITERKAAEREAARARDRFDALFNLVGDGILISDPATGRYVEANEAACRMFGYTKSELLECNVGDLSSGVHPYTLDAAVARNRRGHEGETRVFEWHSKTKAGKLFWCEISLRYVRFGGASAVLALVLVHDISHRKLVEHELLTAKESAENANRAKSDFLAVMSHEIRTPMNGVMGMNALLLETVLTPKQRKMTETVRDSAQALLHLLDDILDVAKLEAGQFALEQARFDLPTLIENVVELVGPPATAKGIDLGVSLDASARGAFQGAPNSLRQVLLNLASNAVKFTESGGVTVAVSQAHGGARLRFEVRDTGIGVPADAKSRLFAPFAQADASISRRFGGSGLGLNICRRLVELMGGEIGMSDRPEGGSVFWFEIDLVRTQASEQAPTETAVATAAVEPQPQRILLAEDDLVNVEVAKLILEAAGYQVDVASDGAQALAAARDADFDLILMDVRMPRMDGWTATQAIRALPTRRGRTPILALTANASEADRQRSRDVGMDDFVTKPFAPNKLREAAARWLHRAPSKGPSEPPPAADETIVDGAVVDDLRSVMTEGQFAALVQMFVTNAQAQARMLAHWLAESRPDEIADLAHKTISSAGALGARRMQKIATRLERACCEDGWASAPGLIAELTRATAATTAALTLLLAGAEGALADETTEREPDRSVG